MKLTHEKKADKIAVLDFIHKRDVVTTSDLMDEFGYAYWGAVNRLRNLLSQRLIKRVHKGKYCLAEDGYTKLSYFGRL